MQGEELQDLLLRSRYGDLEAFSRIVEHFQTPLSRYLLHIVGDTALAEDLTQDTFIELFESLGRDDMGKLQHVQAWLYKAATNNALSRLRRARRFTWLPLSWFGGHAAETASVESRVAERDLVRRVLATLPEQHAACLLLHDAAGLRCTEIAEQQGITLEAAKQRLARARRGFIAAYKGSLQEGESAVLQPNPHTEEKLEIPDEISSVTDVDAADSKCRRR